MQKRILGWLMCLGGAAQLAGCAAPLLMAVPTLMTGAHMTAMVTKERGVTVSFDEKTVEAVTAQKGAAPVRSVGIVSTAPHVIGGGGGVAIAVAEELSVQKSFAVVNSISVFFGHLTWKRWSVLNFKHTTPSVNCMRHRFQCA